MEHPAGFEPAITELQSIALATWLRVHREYVRNKIKSYALIKNYNISMLIDFVCGSGFFFTIEI